MGAPHTNILPLRGTPEGQHESKPDELRAEDHRETGHGYRFRAQEDFSGGEIASPHVGQHGHEDHSHHAHIEEDEEFERPG